MTDQTGLVERTSVDGPAYHKRRHGQDEGRGVSCQRNPSKKHGQEDPRIILLEADYNSHDPPNLLHALTIQPYPSLSRPASHVLALDVK